MLTLTYGKELSNYIHTKPFSLELSLMCASTAGVNARRDSGSSRQRGFFFFHSFRIFFKLPTRTNNNYVVKECGTTGFSSKDLFSGHYLIRSLFRFPHLIKRTLYEFGFIFLSTDQGKKISPFYWRELK